MFCKIIKMRAFGNLSTGFHKIIKYQDISRTFPIFINFQDISSTGKYFPDFPGRVGTLSKHWQDHLNTNAIGSVDNTEFVVISTPCLIFKLEVNFTVPLMEA